MGLLFIILYLFFPTWFLVVEQQLHSSHYFFPDGVQQGIPHVDVVAEQQLDDLQVLVLDGNEEGCASQRVYAVYVDPEVDLSLLQGLLHAAVVSLFHSPQVGFLHGGELSLRSHNAQGDAVPVRAAFRLFIIKLWHCDFSVSTAGKEKNKTKRAALGKKDQMRTIWFLMKAVKWGEGGQYWLHLKE